MSTTDPEQTSGINVTGTMTAGTLSVTDPKGALIATTKALLLDQHQHPEDTADGEHLTRYDRGIREGQIRTYLDVIRTLPGGPDYSALPDDTIRAMLLGQALTEHVSG